MKINTIGDKLRQVRLSKGLNQTEFAMHFGLSQSTYAPYETGKRSVPDELKQQLSQMGINLHWLITGEGSMYLSGDSAALAHVDDRAVYVSTKGNQLAYQIDEQTISVPILTQKLSAGTGQEWTQEDFITERFQVNKRFIRGYPAERIFSAEVRGDSMTGIMLYDGDLVFFIREEVEGDGVYVIAADNDEVLVKRVEFDPFNDQVIIRSENERYEPRTLSVDRVRILGKVIGWLHHHPY